MPYGKLRRVKIRILVGVWSKQHVRLWMHFIHLYCSEKADKCHFVWVNTQHVCTEGIPT